MKPVVFVDTDILVDLLSGRKPFAVSAARLFSLAERGQVHACVSSLSFATLSYLLRKAHPQSRVTEILKRMRNLVTVVSVGEETIDRALESGFKDFEDAIQYAAALDAKATAIVTRNSRDFTASTIRVCTAEEFLATLKATS